MKKLDLYIIRKFLGTFFFIILLLMTIAVIFDVSEKIDDFLKSDAPFDAIIFDYYINFAMHFGNLFSALIIFLAVIWFTSKMAQTSEIVAILSGGISFRRMLFPYFIAATFLAVLSLWLNHFVLPSANKHRLEFEEVYIRNPFKISKKNLHMQVEPGYFVNFEFFYTTKKMAKNLAIEHWEDGKLVTKLQAERAHYDSVAQSWLLENYYVRNYTNEREYLRQGSELDTTFAFTPTDFGRRLNAASAMGYHELNEYIEKERIKGSDQIAFYLIEKYQRTSYPFATYILTLIGVSIASRKQRGGTGVHLALGIGLVFVYIFTMKVATVGATNAGLPPAIAVWIPNAIFLVVGILLYRTAQK